MTALSPVSNGLWEGSFYPTRPQEKLVLSTLPSRQSFEVAQASTTNTVEAASVQSTPQKTSGTKVGDNDSTTSRTPFEKEAIKKIDVIVTKMDTETSAGVQLIHPLQRILLADTLKMKGGFSRGSDNSYTRALDILKGLVGATAGNNIEDFQKNYSFIKVAEEARRSFYLGGVSLAETYLALGRYEEARETLNNLTKLGELKTDQYFTEVHVKDLKLRVCLTKADMLKGIAQKQKGKEKETTLNEAKVALEEASKLITEGTPMVEAAIKTEEDPEKKSDLDDLRVGFIKKQKVLPVSMAEVQLGVENTTGVLTSIRGLTGAKTDQIIHLSDIQGKLPDDEWNEVDRGDLIRRVVFAEVDALKAKALAAKDQAGFQKVVGLLQELQADKTLFAALIRPNTEDFIRYYVSLAEAQLGAKDYEAAEATITKNLGGNQIKFMNEETFKVIKEEKNRLDYLCRANLVLVDALKGKALPGEVAPIVLSPEKKDLLIKATGVLEGLATILGEKKKTAPTDADIEQYLKTEQVSLAEVQLGLKEFRKALEEVKKTANFTPPKDKPEALPTSDDINNAMAAVPKEEVKIDLISRLNGVKFWANFSKIGNDLDLLPSGKEELSRIIERNDETTQEVMRLMGKSTPAEKLSEIISSFSKLQEQFSSLKEEDKKKKEGPLSALTDWLKLKTFEIVKNDEIAGKPNKKELFAQLKEGKYERGGQKVEVPELTLTYDDPKKPLDKELYSILRDLAFEEGEIKGIVKRVLDAKKAIEGAVNKKVDAKVIDQEEAKELIKDYIRNFDRVLEYAETFGMYRTLKDNQSTLKDFKKKLKLK